LAENLARVQPYPQGRDIIRSFDNPIEAPTAIWSILKGKLAQARQVAKITGKEGLQFTARHGISLRRRSHDRPVLAGTIGRR